MAGFTLRASRGSFYDWLLPALKHEWNWNISHSKPKSQPQETNSQMKKILRMMCYSSSAAESHCTFYGSTDFTSLYIVVVNKSGQLIESIRHSRLTSGPALTSSLKSFVISLCKITVSSAQPLFARATSCLMAVRKPCGLKNPVIQKQLGRPSFNHVTNCAFRSSSSANQNDSVVDSQESFFHRAGTRPSNMLSNASRRTSIQQSMERWNILPNKLCRFSARWNFVLELYLVHDNRT